MTEFEAIFEHALTGDYVEGSDMDTNVETNAHWHHICVDGLGAISAGCTAWVQLTAAGLFCDHWEKMNTLWASSQTVGMKATTFREHSKKVQEQLTSDSFERPFQSTHNPNSSVNQDVSGSPNLPNATSDTCMSNYSGFGHSLTSGIAKAKRKASDEFTLQMSGKKLESSMEHVSRAIVESAGMLSNKSARPFDKSAHLFKSLEDMDLCQEELLESYSFLSKNEKEANMFLGTSQLYRLPMLRKIMTSRFMP